MKIAFTGHRPNKLGNDYDLVSEKTNIIKSKIIDLIGSFNVPLNQMRGIVGMALGIDTLAALICFDIGIPFIAAVPCLSQERMWPKKSQDRYKELLLLAERIVYVSQEYSSYCMQKRNIWMVDNSDVLIAVWDGTSGGTANCVKYAESVGKPVYIIRP